MRRPTLSITRLLGSLSLRHPIDVSLWRPLRVKWLWWRPLGVKWLWWRPRLWFLQLRSISWPSVTRSHWRRPRFFSRSLILRRSLSRISSWRPSLSLYDTPSLEHVHKPVLILVSGPPLLVKEVEKPVCERVKGSQIALIWVDLRESADAIVDACLIQSVLLSKPCCF